MIIYKDNIENFIKDCNNKTITAKILERLLNRRGISGVNEKEKLSWSKTLVDISKILNNMFEKDHQYVLLEFVIRDSLKRIDLMIAGKDNNEKSNLIIAELKGWSKINLYKDTLLLNPNVSYGLCNHPSSEAYDYYYILTNCYSDIKDKFNLMPLSLLPNYSYFDNNVLIDKRFNDIISKANSYCKNTQDEFIDLLKIYFNSPISEREVNELDDLNYKPSIDFLKHLKNEFESIRLIGSQNIAFERFKFFLNKSFISNEKILFIISGSAGSGKTVVAFKILNYLVSLAKKTNLILPGPEFRDAIKKSYNKFISKEFIIGANSRVNNEYVIIDEAHKATGNDTAKIFYSRIFKNTSRALISLIDDLQVVNKKGITKNELKEIAYLNNFKIIELDLLEQFRNGGDVSYTNWLKNIIFKDNNNQEKFVNNFFDFRILDEIDFNRLYKEMYDTNNVRMVSFFTQTWDLNALTPTVQIGSKKYIWNPNWQWLAKYKKNGNNVNSYLFNLCNKLNFNKDKKGKEFVGYFNTVQGYEFDYIFVHIPKLFYFHDEKICVNIEELDMNEMTSQIWSTKNIKNLDELNSKNKLNKIYFLNRLFVNLTRGVKGAYVYIEDENLKKYLESKIINLKKS